MSRLDAFSTRAAHKFSRLIRHFLSFPPNFSDAEIFRPIGIDHTATYTIFNGQPGRTDAEMCFDSEFDDETTWRGENQRGESIFDANVRFGSHQSRKKEAREAEHRPRRKEH